MIHWGFLILAFIAGFASCYGIIYRLSKLYDEVMGTVKEATKSMALDD